MGQATREIAYNMNNFPPSITWMLLTVIGWAREMQRTVPCCHDNLWLLLKIILPLSFRLS
jgi:hypothetical protein